MTRTGKRLGNEIAFDPALTAIERGYTRLFGPPILGLRIRARYLRPLLEGLELPLRAKIADAGSGRGCFAFFLARLFPQAQVTGMDIEEPQIRRNNQIAEMLGYDNCRFQRQDVTRLQARHVYDFILSTDTLEHLEQDGVRTITGARCTAVSGEGVHVEYQDGRPEVIPADSVILAVGMRSNAGVFEAMYDCAPEVIPIGDCIRPATIRQASRTGYFTARDI